MLTEEIAVPDNQPQPWLSDISLSVLFLFSTCQLGYFSYDNRIDVTQRPLRRHRPRPRLHRFHLFPAHHREDLQGPDFLVCHLRAGVLWAMTERRPFRKTG
jgi:hypothetical protein